MHQQLITLSLLPTASVMAKVNESTKQRQNTALAFTLTLALMRLVITLTQARALLQVCAEQVPRAAGTTIQPPAGIALQLVVGLQTAQLGLGLGLGGIASYDFTLHVL